MKYLLDTCAISELVKRKPSKTVLDWIRDCDEDTIFLSVLTIGELQKGIAKLENGSRRIKIQQWLDSDLMNRFTGRILPITTEISLTWGVITGDAEARGVSIPSIDGLIGATAISHNLTVVTRNVRDIAITGARFINPWER